MGTLASLNLQINSIEAAQAASALQDLADEGIAAEKMHLRLKDAANAAAGAQRNNAAAMQNAIKIAQQLGAAMASLQTAQAAIGRGTNPAIQAAQANIAGLQNMLGNLIPKQGLKAETNVAFSAASADEAKQVMGQFVAAGIDATRINVTLRKSVDESALAEQKAQQQARDRARAEAQAAREAEAAETQRRQSLRQTIQTMVELLGIYSAIQQVRKAFGDALTEERVEMGLKNITGSAQQAHAMIQQLNDYASHSQFGVDKLENNARILANMGFEAKEVVPTLRAIGNEIEATGGSNEGLDDVVKSLARMNDEGQISVFTLRQMEQQGIPAGRILAQALNESIVEVMKDVRSGTLNAHTTLQLLIRGMAEFGNSSGHAKDSVYVLWNELQNNLRITLKDIAVEFLRAFDVKVGLQNAIDGIRLFDTVIKDVFNVLSGGNPQLTETQGIITTLTASLRIMAGVLAVIVALKFAAMLSTAGVSAMQLTAALLALTGISLVGWFGNQTDAGNRFVNMLKQAGEYAELLHSYVTTAMGGIAARLGGSETPREATRENAAMDQEFTERWNAIGKRYGGAKSDLSPVMAGAGRSGNFGGDMWGNIDSFLKSSLDINWGKITQQMQDAMHKQGLGGDLSKMNANSAYELSSAKSDVIQKDLASLKEQQQTAGATNDLRKMELALLKEREKIGEKVLANSLEANSLLDEYTQEYEKLIAFQQLGAITDGVAKSFGNAFGEFASGAKSAKQAIDDLLKSIEKMAINQFVSKPLENLLSAAGNKVGGSFIDALFGGGGGGQPVGMMTGEYDATAAGFANAGASLLGQARGGAWHRGLQMFADGGMVGSPTFFGMAGGNLGLMGEAGPEAIMPLSRGPDGKLGVRGGGGTVNNQYITMNVQTNDADSFRRNSRQIRQHLSKG